MGLPELKNKVLIYIENADENQLEKISYIFENENQFLKQAIEKSKIQVLNGDTIPHNKVMGETRKRYPKYFKNEY